jgi:hypothetical protein
MTSRSYEIEPVETKDRYGNVTLSYHVWKIDPQGQIQTVCVSRSLTGYYSMIIFRNRTNATIPMPDGQRGNALKTLRDKLDEFDCPYFEIAEPQRRF